MPCLAWSARLAAVAATALALAGCSQSSSTMHIDSVSPQQLPDGRGAQLLVVGRGFQQGDTVSLNSTIVPNAVWVNDQLLSASIPASFAPGRYDLTVSDSNGQRDTKRNAVQIGALAAAATATSVPTRVASATATRAPEMQTRAPSPSPSPSPTPRPQPTVTAGPSPTPTPAPTRQPTAAAARPALDVSGDWRLEDTIEPDGVLVQFPVIVLQQQGSSVSGGGSGITSLQGTLSGNTLTANYIDQQGGTGQFVWTFAADGTSFSGTFVATGVNHGSSRGVRLRGAQQRGAPSLLQRLIQVTRPVPRGHESD